ncbi:MAG TPA: DNA gyrase inhibitor YacG [Methylocella sp.]|jgi:endogenous inhibitor of DNA gyrase (YacG/DUF329 family)
MPVVNPETRFDEQPDGASLRPCPICGKPAVFATRPFCSKRCADVDLHRWLGGVYAIPAAHESDAEPDGAGEQRVAKIPEP